MVNYWSFVKHFLLPARCLLCNTPVGAAQTPSGLCEACVLTLPWLNKACARCALPISSPSETPQLCGNCQHNPPAFTKCHTLFHYQYPVDQMITRLKFQHKLLYANALGELLSQHIQFHYQHLPLPDVIIPVPLHKKRLRERGFNQAEEIARCCANRLNLKIEPRLCWRHKHTAHQPGLSAKQRRRNLKDAFYCQPFKTGTRIALVDDVMTTGTTLNELSRCLKKNGCSEVHLWCVARAHHK